MEKHFATYTQALALKELGFDEPCWSYFITPFDDGEGIFNPSMFLKDYAYLDTMPKHSTYILAPLKSQVFEWFRKEHNLFGVVLCDLCWNISGGVANSYGDAYDWDSERYETYEEAESACIDKLIEIVKTK